MDSRRWKQLDDLLQLALERRPEERDSFVREVSAGNREIESQLRALLKLERDAGSFLESPAIELAARALSRPESEDDLQGPDLGLGTTVTDCRIGEAAETMIGRYYLLQRVGEGGMGEVWLAEQREPVRRRVALKLVKAGMNTREVIARFESERQALALMDHPAIAKVFDAGSTPQGAPYFVMEYVAGVPITDYCDNHQLTTHERLELFIRVCEGVQHAHRKAIIHRDLKPSNILVTEVDGRPAPKVIDFGVAKALTQKLTLETMFTRVGTIIGTLQYMSPEQALSAGEDIDTRTDVYSLGIIFYELLAGAPPLQMQKIALEEFLRRLREEEPPKPSTKIRTQDPATSTETARKRQTMPATLARQIRGDLDSIALKALEKERSRRYGSASELAADIGRYLKNEAVLAVPPSIGYRARKLVRRHRAALAMVTAFVMVLILAAAISIRQSVLATRQRDRADQEAAISQAVNDFLQNDLLAQASAANQSGPNAKPDPHLEVRTALDRAAVRITGKFDRQPQVEAAIRDTIGRTYGDLGQYPQAHQQLERALELYRRVLGPESPKTLVTMSRLGVVAQLQGKYSEAEALLNQSLQLQRRALGPDQPDTVTSMSNLAITYADEGKYAEAEVLHRQILEIRRSKFGAQNPRTLNSMNNLAVVYFQEGKYSQAEALYDQALEIRRRLQGAEHPYTLLAMGNLALIYFQEGKYAQAEEVYDQTLEIQRRVLGPEHPNTLRSMNSLAAVYFQQGKYEKSEALSTQSMTINRRVLGPEHSDTLRSMDDLADSYYQQDKYAQAEKLFDQTLEISRRVLGPEHPFTLSVLSDIAASYQRRGRYALAETYASQALAGQRRTLGLEHPATIASAADLALAYVSQGKFTASEPRAREALEFERKTQPDDWQRFRAESLLGVSLAGLKKYTEAEPLLLEGYRGMAARKSRMAVPDWYHLDRARDWIVQLYQALGKPVQAAEWRKK
jgi:eukaryotic-like serine/threonine-protein kinase